MCTMGEEGTTSACLCVPPAPLGFLLGTTRGCMGTSTAGAARQRAGCRSAFPAVACCPTKVSNLGSILCLLRAPVGGDGGLPSVALLGWGHFAISSYGHSLETAFLGHAHGRPAAHFRKPMSGAVRSVLGGDSLCAPGTVLSGTLAGQARTIFWQTSTVAVGTAWPGCLVATCTPGTAPAPTAGVLLGAGTGMPSSRVPVHRGQNLPSHPGLVALLKVEFP